MWLCVCVCVCVCVFDFVYTICPGSVCASLSASVMRMPSSLAAGGMGAGAAALAMPEGGNCMERMGWCCPAVGDPAPAAFLSDGDAGVLGDRIARAAAGPPMVDIGACDGAIRAGIMELSGGSSAASDGR